MTSWDLLSKFILVGDSATGKSSLLVRLTDQRFLADPDPTVGVEFGSYIVDIPETGERIKCQCWDTAGSETFRSITRSYYRGAAGALLVYNITHRASFRHIADWLRDVREHAEEDVSIILVGNMSDLCEAEDREEEEAAVAAAAATAAAAAEATSVEETGVTGSAEAESSKIGQGEASSANASQSNTPRSSPRKRNAARRRQVTREEAEAFAKKENIMFVETSAKTGQNVEEAFQRAARDIHAKFQASSSSQHPRRAGLASSGVNGSRPGIITASGDSRASEGRCCVVA